MVFYHLLAALGYETRWIVDWTDHNWVEVRVKDSWIHLDPSVAVWMVHVISLITSYRLWVIHFTRHIAYEWVTSYRLWMGHVISHHTAYEWFISHTLRPHMECVKNPTWSGFIWTRALWYEWVTWQVIRLSQVGSHRNESCHIPSEIVMSHPIFHI